MSKHEQTIALKGPCLGAFGKRRNMHWANTFCVWGVLGMEGVSFRDVSQSERHPMHKRPNMFPSVPVCRTFRQKNESMDIISFYQSFQAQKLPRLEWNSRFSLPLLRGPPGHQTSKKLQKPRLERMASQVSQDDEAGNETVTLRIVKAPDGLRMEFCRSAC